MNAIQLALAYLRDRPGQNLFNALLLALGVATIVILLHLSHAISSRLDRDARGIDLVVGAKGSPLQLILSSIFHADVPTGNITLADADRVRRDPGVRAAIPLALGDSFRTYRIVGTTPDYVALYDGALESGVLWTKPFEAVLGATVAEKLAMPLGTRFTGSHGLGAGGHDHDEAPYTVTGILKPTGTVLDRLILTSVDSVVMAHTLHMEEEPGHAHEHGEAAEDDAHDHDHGAEALEPTKRDLSQEITALLVQYRSPLAAIRLPAKINQTTAMQAAVPAIETTRLLSIIGVGLDAVRAFAGILLLSAALGIFVALYTAMSQRAGDIAMMRTMGAGRGRILAQVLLEGVLLALAGGIAGLAMAHGLLAVGARLIPEAGLIGLSGGIWLAGEAWLLGGVVVAGALAALIPAMRAYGVDIIATLSKNQ